MIRSSMTKRNFFSKRVDGVVAWRGVEGASVSPGAKYLLIFLVLLLVRIRSQFDVGYGRSGAALERSRLKVIALSVAIPCQSSIGLQHVKWFSIRIPHPNVFPHLPFSSPVSRRMKIKFKKKGEEKRKEGELVPCQGRGH